MARPPGHYPQNREDRCRSAWPARSSTAAPHFLATLLAIAAPVHKAESPAARHDHGRGRLGAWLRLGKEETGLGETSPADSFGFSVAAKIRPLTRSPPKET